MHRFLCFLILGLPVLTLANDEAAKAEVMRILTVAEPQDYSPINKAEGKLAKEIAEHGEAATPYLIELLENDRPEVRKLAAYSLGFIETIDPKYMPAIRRGLERRIPWLTRALGGVGTDEAAELCVEIYLRDPSSPSNQPGFVITKFGAKPLPYLFAALQKPERQDDMEYFQQGPGRTAWLIGCALAEMEPKVGEQAAWEILRRIETEPNPAWRNVLLKIMAAIGEPANVVEPQVAAMWRNQDEVRATAAQALLSMNSQHTGQIYKELVPNIQGDFGHWLLLDIARSGNASLEAGPEIADQLKHPRAEVRLYAARTLGYVGYHGANDQLAELLNDPRDLRINWAAAKSLGYLQAESAQAALQQTASTHWHPAIQDAAREALSQIDAEEPPAKDEFGWGWAFSIPNPEQYAHEEPTVKIVEPPPSEMLLPERDEEALAKLAYASAFISYGANDVEQQREEKGEDAIVVVHQGNMAEHHNEITQTPQVALRVEHGWLAGASRGEWGGELMFIGDDGARQKIIDDNIRGIYRLGDRIVAVAGLAHLGLSDGCIYAVERQPGGQWRAFKWRIMPGAVVPKGQLPNGDLYLTTYEAGNVILDVKGGFRMAPPPSEDAP